MATHVHIHGARTTDAGESKVEKVMHEYKEGSLHSGSKEGPKVKNRKQAAAIALSEAGKSRDYGTPEGARKAAQTRAHGGGGPVHEKAHEHLTGAGWSFQQSSTNPSGHVSQYSHPKAGTLTVHGTGRWVHNKSGAWGANMTHLRNFLRRGSGNKDSIAGVARRLNEIHRRAGIETGETRGNGVTRDFLPG